MFSCGPLLKFPCPHILLSPPPIPQSCPNQAACGGTYSQNLTYWSTTSTSPCSINVCKCQEEVTASDPILQPHAPPSPPPPPPSLLQVCFLKLDFATMQLKGPETDTTAAVVTQTSTTPYSAPTAGQCRSVHLCPPPPALPPPPGMTTSPSAVRGRRPSPSYVAPCSQELTCRQHCSALLYSTLLCSVSTALLRSMITTFSAQVC